MAKEVLVELELLRDIDLHIEGLQTGVQVGLLL
jgi:hypothetical protein